MNRRVVERIGKRDRCEAKAVFHSLQFHLRRLEFLPHLPQICFSLPPETLLRPKLVLLPLELSLQTSPLPLSITLLHLETHHKSSVFGLEIVDDDLVSEFEVEKFRLGFPSSSVGVGDLVHGELLLDLGERGGGFLDRIGMRRGRGCMLDGGLDGGVRMVGSSGHGGVWLVLGGDCLVLGCYCGGLCWVETRGREGGSW